MGLFDGIRTAFNTTFRPGGLTLPEPISDAYAQQGMDSSLALGPGQPLTPVRGYSGQPRAMDYPAAVNIGYRNRQAWGRTSYEVLRELLRSYDIATICKNHKIDELRSMEPLFTAQEGFNGDADAAIRAARRALEFPDRENPWDQWLAMWMENILTFDAGPLYRRRNYNGDVIGLEVVDGATVYPLVDGRGRRPGPPAVAYQQIIKGEVSQQFTSEDLLFTTFRKQQDSPYGMAPLESIVVNMSTDLKHQWHLLQMFTEGSIPGGFMEAPPDTSSPDQVAEWQDYWDSMFMGDQSILHKLVIVPNSAKFTATAPDKFDPLFPEWLAKKTAMSFGVVPQDLGFTADVNRANGETQTDIQFRVNTLPWVRFVERHMSRYLQHDLGLPVEFKLNTGRDTEDRLAEAQAWKIYVDTGIASVDEAREELLGLPVDNERPIPRFYATTRQGLIPFNELLAIAGKSDAETKAPAVDADLPYPSDATPGLFPDKLPGNPDFKRAPQDPDDPAHPETEHPHPAQPVPATPAAKEAQTAPTVAGLAVVADDTGRVLLLQRALTDGDPAAGRWELPGGHIEGRETPFAAACREWSEETGLELPPGREAGSWQSGIYAGFVWLIGSETDLPINLSEGRVQNPDDPGGDQIETCAWWEPADVPGMGALRFEAAANPWDMIAAAASGDAAAARRAELAKFAAFTKARHRSGRWRDFDFRHHTPTEAAALNKAARDAGGSPKGDWRATPPNPTAYHRIDLTLTDYWAPRVADAIRNGADPDLIAAAAHAGAWDTNGATLTGDALAQVLAAMWADAANAGTLAAAADTGQDPNSLDGWKPGALEGPPTGAVWLEAMNRAGTTIKGIDDTTLTRIGAIVEDAVTRGLTVDSTANLIDAFLGDAARAELIAHTEIARLATAAGMAAYRSYGVTQWDWVVSAGACPVCLDGASRNPYPMSEQGLIPAHPRCRCAASPHAPH
ncbi:hypothetical protein SCMU_13940 [Sinomonas cyclohexanicum]|uniref:Nudix hydrolase domain-containing protein n=1 Tax=Sinomonas cyclohexanicum TaxID=322009 RepID=A0ABM7PTU6_SINCY|nr:phage portal protein [Corynebacterium cyclohexanicum]BCT75552.1 hypothetical protein SCMU_13940 [Corynebacterium cyclohexanicum]